MGEGVNQMLEASGLGVWGRFMFVCRDSDT